MEIREAKPYDKALIQDLWQYCFDDSMEFVDWFFNTRYEDDNTLVLFDNNRICSALQLLPYYISLRGKKMQTSYIVGVSTWPQDRGKGYISKLLYKSLEIMRERKQWVSILLPFNYNFYRKYGWETCYSYHQYSGHKNSFTEFLDGIEIQGKVRPISLASDFQELEKCYNLYTQKLNGYIIRGKKDWDRILADVRIDGGDGYIYQVGHQTMGYIFLVDNREGLSIRTICSKDMRIYLEMLKFAVNCSLKSQQIYLNEKIGLTPLPNIIESNIIKQERPFVMGRIVDVQKALESIPVFFDSSIVIQVVDPILQWNNLNLELGVEGNGLSALPTHKFPDFIIPISVLSQLLWGYYTSMQAIDYGLIQVNDPGKVKWLEALFPNTIPYIYEDY